MSISSSIRPTMARVSALATAIQGEFSLEAIVNSGYSAAKKSLNVPIWDKKIDVDVQASLFSNAMKVAKGTYHLTYKDFPPPSCLIRDKDDTYWVKKECTPASGVKSLLEGPTTTDCGGAVKAITIKAIADLIGEEKFNALLSHSLMPLNFSKSTSHTPNLLDFFTLPAHTHFHSAELSHITLGTRLYFQGIPWYGVKHPTGSGHGHWALYLDNTTSGERLYWALGFDRLVTENELLEDLLNQYNTPQSEESKALQSHFSSKEAFLDFMKTAHQTKLKGYDAEMVRCYDEPNIKMSMDEARAVGLGFFGYALTERVSSTALKILQAMSLPAIQDPTTPTTLGIYHISLLVKQLFTTPPEDPAIPKTTSQAKNFIKWVEE